MDAKRFLKWAACLAAVVVSIIYLASALLVSEKVASLVDFRTTKVSSFKMVPDVTGKEARMYATLPDSDKGKEHEGTTEAAPYHLVPVPGARSSFAGVLPNLVRLVLLTALLLAPIAIFYVFLFRPLRDIPLVESDALAALDDDNPRRRKEAGGLVAEAMLSTSSCSDENRRILRDALEHPTDIDKTVKMLLARREILARGKAVEIATMAGLTVAASSSAMGDGLGMLFWKSKLVYETFRIYGFRPDARTTLSIWAHVVFASLFAASVEELCDLFDVSDLVGGLGVRGLQGAVGIVVILKGGQLARAYLTQGISAETRKSALKEFRSSAAEEFNAVGHSITDSLKAISKGRFSLSTIFDISLPQS